jgi:AbrB family looped-hinge helix DNA binding protein
MKNIKNTEPELTLEDLNTVKLSSKSQIVVPKSIRQQLKLKNGDRLALVPKGNVVFLMKIPDSYSKSLKGILSNDENGRLIEDLKKNRRSWK